MTDAELDALERVLKNMLHGKSVLSLTQTIKPEGVLELIEELRLTRKERDWVIQNIRPTDVGPTACPTKEIWYNCDEGLKTPRNKDVCHKCWLDAAKEAVSCQKQLFQIAF